MLFFGAFEMSCVGSNEEETAIVFLSLVKIFISEPRSYLCVDKPGAAATAACLQRYACIDPTLVGMRRIIRSLSDIPEFLSLRWRQGNLGNPEIPACAERKKQLIIQETNPKYYIPLFIPPRYPSCIKCNRRLSAP